jgi:PAS domain S-box-containing protein
LTDDSLWSNSIPVFADPEIHRIVPESMQTGLYMVNCDQRTRFWDQGAEKITGYLRQAVVGHSCRDFFPPQKEEAKKGICEIGGARASVLRDERPATAEITLRHKAGHRVIVRIRAVPIQDAAGPVIGAAESIDADPWAFEADRRHRKLASYGCLEEATGVRSNRYIPAHIRESLAIVQYMVAPNAQDAKAADAAATTPRANAGDAKTADGKPADEKAPDATKPAETRAAKPGPATH